MVLVIRKSHKYAGKKGFTRLELRDLGVRRKPGKPNGRRLRTSADLISSGIFQASCRRPGRKRRALRGAHDPPRGAPIRREARASQRERLIDAIIELAGQHGYQGLSIAQISARAGVSSATFYEQFADREDCLLAAYRDATERTLAADAEPRWPEGEWTAPCVRRSAELLTACRPTRTRGG